MELSKLKEPFKANELEWRLQQCGESNGRIWGKCLCYISNRSIQARLDKCVGEQNWRNEYKEGPSGGILCGISIKVGDEWITKWDGADNTQVESVKGGLSDAMKRAGVQWGIGRYLYDLPEGWITVCDDGIYNGKTKEGKWFRWNPPALPEWALPKGEETFQKAEVNNPVTSDNKPTETNTSSKGRRTKTSATTANEEEIKAKGNSVISRIGLIMKREENGRMIFTEPEINQIRTLVANTQLTENGIKELEELENVVRMELESRLSKLAA